MDRMRTAVMACNENIFWKVLKGNSTMTLKFKGSKLNSLTLN
jgi:hypothetical protein